eukprot:1161360-Pelagomonas_calceolata.AAC.11
MCRHLHWSVQVREQDQGTGTALLMGRVTDWGSKAPQQEVHPEASVSDWGSKAPQQEVHPEASVTDWGSKAPQQEVHPEASVLEA